MKQPAHEIRSERFHRILTTVVILTLAGSLPQITLPHLLAKTPAGQSSKTLPAAGQGPQSRQAMEAARVRMAFDVTSVKPNRSNAPASAGFPLGPGDGYAQNGGIFTAANQPLIVYLRFAFKLGQGDLLGLPVWVYNDRFDIEARVQGNPTKDEMRLMMQSLLDDRFKLTRHTERRTRPVLHLVLSKAGKIGPQLRAHSDDGSCSTVSTDTSETLPPPAPSAPSSTSGLQLPPIACGGIGPIPASAPGRGRLGGRRVTMGRIAGFLKNPYTGLDRPVVDRTGLTGTFDLSLEWSLGSDAVQAPDPGQPPASHPEDSGPTFLEALQEQLGLKLKAATGPVDVLVIDHVGQPSPN